MVERGDIGDIDGKTVLVTGASSGIGLTACVELARRGAKIILSGRNPEKTAGSAEQVRAEAKYPDAVSVELCDMADLSDIRALGERLRTRLPSLDVLVNNAGAMHTHRKTTADGFEMTYGVNHLGYFLTTLELLPLLQSAPAARVVNVASDAHRAARLDLNDVHVHRARELGVPVVISTDAHNPDGLHDMRFGVDQARRGWLSPDDVLNTRSLADFRKWLGRRG